MERPVAAIFMGRKESDTTEQIEMNCTELNRGTPAPELPHLD